MKNLFAIPKRTLWTGLLFLVGLGMIRAGPESIRGQGTGAESLVVHEWGTFTCLQNDEGDALSGINTDDEPVPAFVHRLAFAQLRTSQIPNFLFQGAPHAHPGVTMRLETPVIYFYSQGTTQHKVDVLVKFNGGWLTEFFPDASSTATGMDSSNESTWRMGPETWSSLAWKNLIVGSTKPLMETKDPVWLAPRHVQSTRIQTQAGEAESYLFYRGVGALSSPLRVKNDGKRYTVSLQSPELSSLPGKMWLVDIRPGKLAFRTLKSNPGVTQKTTENVFSDKEYSREGMKNLHNEIHAALKTDGLYEEEASAMLKTWEEAYFKSPGLRLFFLLPQKWTDQILPLEITSVPQITRVMMGRIELMAPWQREALTLLSRANAEEIKSEAEALRRQIQAIQLSSPQDFLTLVQGRKKLSDLGLKPPPFYNAYLNLGRFRHSLVASEAKNNPHSSLPVFMQYYALNSFGEARPTTRK